MTRVWGPMGWMTLHSISVCYPEEPTQNDKAVLEEFMNAFGITITCIHCKNHFISMFSDYRSKVPAWKDSRRDLFLAISRMHNAVNKRLEKPQPKTVSGCVESLKLATRYSTPSQFREKYITYLFGDWRKHGNTSESFAAIKATEVMKKINEDYWNKREVSYSTISFPEDDVLTYGKITVPPSMKEQLSGSKLSGILTRISKKSFLPK
jgi:hypothetical protein